MSDHVRYLGRVGHLVDPYFVLERRENRRAKKDRKMLESNDTFRVYVRRSNMTEGERSVFVDITQKMSFKKFLKQAGKKLGIKATKCYVATSTGGHNEIKFIDEMKMDDELIIATDSESFGSNKGQETMFISVLGAGGVGKSALTLRFVRDFFVQDWDPTIEDAYRKTVEVDGRICMLELLDTAGQDDFESLRHQWMQEKQGYIFVYSLNSRQSLDELDLFFQLHEQINGQNSAVPIILVANKKDICDLDPKERQVSLAEGKRKAEEFKAVHIETSAATGENVLHVFETLIREVRKRKAPSKQTHLGSKCSIL